MAQTTKEEIEEAVAAIRAAREKKQKDALKEMLSEIDKQIETERKRRQAPFKGITRNTEQ